MTTRKAFIIGGAVIALGSAEAMAGSAYTVVEILAQPGHEYMNISGLNNNGQVLANSFLLDGVSAIAPFVWSPAGGTRLLDTGGYWAAYAGAFNDAGSAVGDPKTIWSPGGAASPLNFVPFQINNPGQVFGVSETMYGTDNHPVIWSESDGRIDFPSTGPGQYSILDANDSGVAVGNRSIVEVSGGEPGGVVSRDFPVLITTTGIVEPPLLPGFDQGSIRAINNEGMMIGYSSDGVTSRPTMWLPDGSLVDLGADRWITDLNNLGQVLGNGPDGPFLWTASDGFSTIDLPMDFGVDAFVVKLNDLGQIVIGDWTQTPNHYYLLTPIPAPGACVLVMAAGLVAARRGRRTA